MHSARENKKKKQKKRERKRNKKRLGVCECIGEGRRIQQAAKKDENPVNYARYFFVHLSRAPSLVWTISITTVLKFNDSEPNELHLDKFAFVGFVALVPRNTVNLTREPTGVMNYGEYEFVRPFFILSSPAPSSLLVFRDPEDSADPELLEPYPGLSRYTSEQHTIPFHRRPSRRIFEGRKRCPSETKTLSRGLVGSDAV